MAEIGIVVLCVILAGLLAWRWDRANQDVRMHTSGQVRPFATRHHWNDNQERP